MKDVHIIDRLENLIDSFDYEDFNEHMIDYKRINNDYVGYIIYDRLGNKLYCFKWVDIYIDPWDYDNTEEYHVIKSELMRDFLQRKYRNELDKIYKIVA